MVATSNINKSSIQSERGAFNKISERGGKSFKRFQREREKAFKRFERERERASLCGRREKEKVKIQFWEVSMSLGSSPSD